MSASSAGDAGRWRRAFRWVAAACAAWAVALLAGAAAWGGDAWRAVPAGDLLAALGVASAVGFVANHALRFARWHWMLRIEGHRVPWRRSLGIFMAGLALVPTPGKAGVAVRSLLLQRDGVPVNLSLALYFTERLFDLLGLAALAALLLGTQGRGSWATALAVGLGAIVAVRIAPAVLVVLADCLPPGGRPRRIIDWVRLFVTHSAQLAAGRYALPFLLLGAGANIATAGVLAYSLAMLGQSIGAAKAAGVVAISHLSGSLSLLPGGLGGFEAAMLAALAALGAAPGAALAALAAVRLVTIWFGVLVGMPLLVKYLREAEGPSGTAR